MLQTILSAEETLVNRANLIFCLCTVCLNEVNWRHFDATVILHAECCCHAYRAFPAREDLDTYRVQTKPCDMTNVTFLHRKSPLDQPLPPKYA